MLTPGINRTTEISILPTGLGNHYTSKDHLIPPGRKVPFSRRNSLTSRMSMNPDIDDPNAPEANMSFRSQSDYFGPDVLVILGVVLASGGAILTLVSFYCQFKHPAIQATIAGIGPSLIGIGMLFCALRLFFCKYFTSRTCCECLADGISYLTAKCACIKNRHQNFSGKKRIHPMPPRNINAPNTKIIINGNMKQTDEAAKTDEHQESDRNTLKVKMRNRDSALNSIYPSHNMEMTSIPERSEQSSLQTLHESAHRQMTQFSDNAKSDTDITDDLIGSCDELQDEESHSHKNGVDDVFKDEIAKLDNRLGSADSSRVRNQSINELVLKHAKT